MQTVKERVQEMLDNANLSSEVNKEAELWNILYNISSDLKVSATDVYDTKNKDLVGQIDAYEAMYYNNFPKQEGDKLPKETKEAMKIQAIFYGLGFATGALVVKLFLK